LCHWSCLPIFVTKDGEIKDHQSLRKACPGKNCPFLILFLSFLMKQINKTKEGEDHLTRTSLQVAAMVADDTRQR
jgi:hypothetical protein